MDVGQSKINGVLRALDDLTVRCKTRGEWATTRPRRLGASDAAKILGQSSSGTPYSTWAEKAGLIKPDDISDVEAVWWGSNIEELFCQRYAMTTGRTVVRWPQDSYLRHPDKPHITCTPDALQFDEERGVGMLQLKTESPFNRSAWDEEPPIHHQIQVQTELAVSGLPWTTIAVLFGTQELVTFDRDRNEEFIRCLLPELDAFWHLVQTNTPPPVDASPLTAKALAALHPKDSGESVELPEEAADWTDRMERLKDRISEMESRVQLYENQIKAAIGDATFGVLPDGSKWSWKTQTRKAYQVQESTFRVLRRTK